MKGAAYSFLEVDGRSVRMGMRRLRIFVFLGLLAAEICLLTEMASQGGKPLGSLRGSATWIFIGLSAGALGYLRKLEGRRSHAQVLLIAALILLATGVVSLGSYFAGPRP